MLKKILLIGSLMLAGLAQAATTVPPQLINPAGSTAGQAIVSTGAATAPAWGNVTATALAPVAANSVIANATGSSAAPTAHAVPSCSTANSALKWTSGTGLSCGTAFALATGDLSQFASTTSAQLAGVISNETGSGALVFGTAPSLTTPTIAGATLSGTFAGTPTFSGAVAFTSTITPSQTAGIVGTTTNNNANAGSVGEYVTAQTLGTSLTNNTAFNATSVSLTAGDWDVEAVISFAAGGASSITRVFSGVSTTSLTNTAPNFQKISGVATGNDSIIVASPTVRVSIVATTTVYAVGQASFSGTATADGYLRARRVR